MAMTCLFVACKIEDTIKKLRDILVVGYQIRHPNGPDVNPESQTMEEQRKRVIGLERMVLEVSCFDFRGRHSQRYLIKLSRYYKLGRELARLGWKISVDCYRTFIPLKHTPQTIALSCLEFAGRLSGQRLLLDAERFFSKRVQVESIVYSRLLLRVGVVHDLLELYIHYRLHTVVGNVYSEDDFMGIGIAINREGRGEVGVLDGGLDELEGIPTVCAGERGIVRYVLDKERMGE